MLFFELLQVALDNCERLSKAPSAIEWKEIYAESERQTVVGILLHGIERLSEEQKPPQVLLLQWIGVGQMIEQRNRVMDERCLHLLKVLSDYGLQGIILKGQGIARLYDKELQKLRHSGDIDVYVNCGLKRAFEFANSLDQKDIDWDYKHLHLNIWSDTEVEMHYRVEVLLNLWKNRKLQKWFKDHVQDLNFDHNVNSNDIRTPSVEFNGFYILLHIYRHFLYEGIGFRQIIDYYFVLKKMRFESREPIKYFQKKFEEFGMMKFARGLMWVMKECLGMPDSWMICDEDEKEGRYILNQIMAGGNFGHHDERLKFGNGKIGAVMAILKHNWHLLWHYPSDVIWAPIWIVWHKGWKIYKSYSL